MQTLTVVFQISDKESFSDMQEMLNERFSEKHPEWFVSAMSIYDEMTRLDSIQKITDSLYSRDALTEIEECFKTDPDYYDVDKSIAKWSEA